MAIKRKTSYAQLSDYLVSYLFQPQHIFVTGLIGSIRNKQYTKHKTPNFFYRGVTYVKHSKYSVPMLDSSLKEDMKTYLNAYDLFVHQKFMFKTYLSSIEKHCESPADLYWLLPKSMRHLFDNLLANIPENMPAHIEDLEYITPDYVEAIIAEQLMHKLIG